MGRHPLLAASTIKTTSSNKDKDHTVKFMAKSMRCNFLKLQQRISSTWGTSPLLIRDNKISCWWTATAFRTISSNKFSNSLMANLWTCSIDNSIGTRRDTWKTRWNTLRPYHQVELAQQQQDHSPIWQRVPWDLLNTIILSQSVDIQMSRTSICLAISLGIVSLFPQIRQTNLRRTVRGYSALLDLALCIRNMAPS